MESATRREPQAVCSLPPKREKLLTIWPPATKRCAPKRSRNGTTVRARRLLRRHTCQEDHKANILYTLRRSAEPETIRSILSPSKGLAKIQSPLPKLRRLYRCSRITGCSPRCNLHIAARRMNNVWTHFIKLPDKKRICAGRIPTKAPLVAQTLVCKLAFFPAIV